MVGNALSTRTRRHSPEIGSHRRTANPGRPPSSLFLRYTLNTAVYPVAGSLTE